MQEAFAPFGDDLSGKLETLADLPALQAFRGKEDNNSGAHNLKIR